MAGKVKLRTVRHCHSVLRRALQDATDKGALPSNPAVQASPPKTSATRAPETAVWNPSRLAVFLDQTRDHHLGALIRMAAMTGLRRGELCGLRWSDLDLDGCQPECPPDHRDRSRDPGRVRREVGALPTHARPRRRDRCRAAPPPGRPARATHDGRAGLVRHRPRLHEPVTGRRGIPTRSPARFNA